MKMWERSPNGDWSFTREIAVGESGSHFPLHFQQEQSLMLKRFCLALLLTNCIPLVTAQVHQHGTTSKEDGRYNPFVAADPRGGFYHRVCRT